MMIFRRHPWLTWLLSSGLIVAATVALLGITETPVVGTAVSSGVTRWLEAAVYPALQSAVLLAVPLSAFFIASKKNRDIGVLVIVAALASQVVVIAWEVTLVSREPKPPLEERYSRWLTES